MSNIKGRDTQPERLLRRALHGLGYRYRLNDTSLPGRPDLVFPSRRKIIFVHGCFWHRHNCRLGRPAPSTRKDFWAKKLERNQARDKEVRRALKKLGWNILTVWECQLKELSHVMKRVSAFLDQQP
jgi:DNA mismatch endonuclease (patch repair protein)